LCTDQEIIDILFLLKFFFWILFSQNLNSKPSNCCICTKILILSSLIISKLIPATTYASFLLKQGFELAYFLLQSDKNVLFIPWKNACNVKTPAPGISSLQAITMVILQSFPFPMIRHVQEYIIFRFILLPF
jgi:hypothetical protein